MAILAIVGTQWPYLAIYGHIAIRSCATNMGIYNMKRTKIAEGVVKKLFLNQWKKWKNLKPVEGEEIKFSE